MYTRFPASSPAPAPGAASALTRRRLLRHGTAAAGALLAAGPLSGCASPAAADPSALSVWDLFQGGDGTLMNDMIKAVSKGPQGFDVKRTILDWGPSYYTKLAMSAAGGRASDVAIMHLSRLAGYAPAGLVDPIDLDVLAGFGVSEKDFTRAVWARTQHDKTVYAVPLDVHPFIVFYDKEAADKAGLLDSSGELAPMGSPEALIDAGKALAKATGQKGILFGHVTDPSQSWRLFAALYAQTGASFTLPDGGPPQIDIDAAVRVVTFMQQLFDGRTNPNNLDYYGAVANFIGGRAGMVMLGEWELPALKKSGIPLGAAPFPQVFDQPAVYTDSHSFVLPHQDNPDPARRREAHRYIAEIIKQSLTWASAGHIPAYQPVIAEPAYAALDPQSSYAKAAEVAVLDPPNWFAGAGSNFQSRMCQPLQSALLRNTSAEKAVRQMVREANTLLRQPNPVA
ncbi:multiple sugar transport system substrate-binding protein [Streptomyces sp. SAI-135]|jgi:multiple sugar transport system substrate-binding protein|uniref:extracellular solute-binding protein n=1 Tax=unclassified Streptomyces TaxID=2593676 RepID=UPI0024760201|nr:MULTISPECIES: extracellular solute-binding protein [unclassified Streptomyces]MDH6523050.1 multiple sugar transport system substrate-binding protein [Streptomyces sp. SAI-090]MDH6554663.1 multiple sugar transport system substrate-binding protein [Streptomyces sp. SAI-041]MDH6573933.1 multiple sugar transport system substrate-binding protein [Streptomyces sp. SAI-117]MDH6581330.1 multiple sugar transport system substrate-binding protein [Streptomyces sp. SAI-133]MDH6613337.1 multiple sugar t